MPIDTVTPNETATIKKTVYDTNSKRQPTEPRPERNGALLLDITVGDPFATIDCRKVEHVRNGEEVIFSSNKKCKLVFDNNDPVFDEHEKEIGPGETTLRVTKYAQGWTHCSVDPLEDGKEIPKEFHSPPKIEVP